VISLMMGLVPVAMGLTLKEGYDPMELPEGVTVEEKDVEMVDGKRGREIPLRVYYDAKATKALPVVLFSHGLGGSRENNGYVGRHWAARGYVVVAMQHAGSDEAVWKEAKGGGRFAKLKEAANVENALARFADVTAVLDQLEKWEGEEGHWLHGKMDLTRVGMSGHSFGAVTTQAVSGQGGFPGGAKYTEGRIDAALAMSPSLPAWGTPEAAFGKVKIPWMLMTGTKDSSSIGRTTAEDRRKVYPALPPGGKYELVLNDGEHMAFSDRTILGREHRNLNHHRAIIALSTAFWDSYLKNEAGAKGWLDGQGAKGVLEEGDLWERK